MAEALALSMRTKSVTVGCHARAGSLQWPRSVRFRPAFVRRQQCLECFCGRAMRITHKHLVDGHYVTQPVPAVVPARCAYTELWRWVRDVTAALQAHTAMLDGSARLTWFFAGPPRASGFGPP